MQNGSNTDGVRLLLLILLLILFVGGVFFTIYINVRAISYVQAYRRLLERRQSQIIASQIGELCLSHSL